MTFPGPYLFIGIHKDGWTKHPHSEGPQTYNAAHLFIGFIWMGGSWVSTKCRMRDSHVNACEQNIKGQRRKAGHILDKALERSQLVRSGARGTY